MNRYRTTFPEDDPSITDGDNSLVGADYYDTNENIPPGLCQAATNVDFTTQDAVTRGGMVCLPSLGATPFSNYWVSETAAAANQWTAVTFGAGLYVAVANSGSGNRVQTSSDGVTWFIQSSAANNAWVDVCYGFGLFVAVAGATGSGSGNRIMTSPDGVVWTIGSGIPDKDWTSIAYGNGVFVAVADDGTTSDIMTSPDGLVWTSRTSPNSNGWIDIVFGNALFVAISPFGGAGTAMSSADGITWTAHSTGNSNTWISLTYGNGVYVAVANGGTNTFNATSTDGATWTQGVNQLPLLIWSIAFGNGFFIALRGGLVSYKSTNGIVWVPITTAAANTWLGIVHGPGRWVAVSTTGSSRVQIFDDIRVWASGRYSDPNSTDQPWVVLAGASYAGFFAFGQTSRTVNYPAGFTISEQSCIVQANNFLFIFGGPDKTPIYWDGSWGGTFIPVPASTFGVGFMDIPMSNSALYYQNRLWVVDGKDVYAASQSLDFQNFNDLTDVFNLNVGTSDFLVTSYPFGNNSIVVFKNHSSYLLQNVSGDLTDVTSTEITRQLGIVGINAVTAVGPDIVYVSSDRNITSVRLNIQNATQAITVPLSRDINPLMSRVNWNYGSKISVGYWNNYLFVAMPFDNATVCNTVLVYNFITNKWFGEWNFDSSINMAIQGWVTANYLGQIRMHAITEDGRIFVVNEGQNDVSGTTVADIAFSMTSRAYPMNNDNRFNRRMWADLQTNRPNFSIRGYVDGVNEYSDLITNQTYLRSQSWLYPTPTYSSDNSSNDFNQAFRKDYSTGPNSIQCGTGFLPEAEQEYRFPLIFRRNGRLVWYRVTNTTGRMTVNGIGGEARAGYRSNLVEIG